MDCDHYVKKNGGKAELFSPFLVLLFLERKEPCIKTQMTCAIVADGFLSECIVRKCFTRFKSENFNLEDRANYEWATGVDAGQTETLIKNNDI